MISRFFIDRPIFASVVSIVITLSGAIAGWSLPVTQYPSIAPPTVQVSVQFPGASAAVVADTVAAPVEQQVNGVENMLYMSSISNNDGSYNLTVTFDLGTDLNTALVMVQNRVALALPQLPTSVQRQGITIRKRTPDILFVINFYSPDDRYDNLYISNYATIFVRDELFRVPGLSDIFIFGQRDYSIRAWLDPELAAGRNLSASEIALAMQQQNLPLVSGQLGQQPAAPGVTLEPPIGGVGRLSSPEQFDDVVLRATTAVDSARTPQVVLLRDVARVEMGAQSYVTSCTLNGKPSVGLAVYQLPGTNALDVGDRVKARLKQLRERFPEGIDYEIAYDTTPFIEESVQDVVKTLFEAVALVALVVLAFLQSWRASLIPLIAVPVAIIGTFAVMAALGFTLNNISLMGLVLAISIVVDDAIVVVENVERWLEHGLAPRDAAYRAMDEVTSPVIAVAVVLSAVFVPCAFISGITGQFFRQFAVTIAASTLISALNSLTLSPALSALLLKPRGARRDPFEWLLDKTFGWFFWLFNHAFEACTRLYTATVRLVLRVPLLMLAAYAGLLAITYAEFRAVPTGFIPQQDQGRLIVNVQLPDSASLERSERVTARLVELALKTPGVRHVVASAGFSLLTSSNSSNFSNMFVVLDSFENRRSRDLSADAIARQLNQTFAREVRDAVVNVFGAPAVPGLGIAAGFKLMVEDRGSLGLDELQRQTDRLIATLRQQQGLFGIITLFRSNTPQLYLDIDRFKVKSLGIPLAEVNNALQIFLGSYYTNPFNAFGRFWQVNIMADGEFRRDASQIGLIKVKNNLGQMIPMSTLATPREIAGPVMVNRYNLYNAAPINGSIAPFLSSGQAIAEIERLAAATLPRSMIAEWTELTLMETRAGNTAFYVFGLSVVAVFLALAALYESWSLPFAVILVVPLCVLCSVTGVIFGRLAINIFVQIGFVVLVGLACKNAILIVEFAKLLREQGKPLAEATIEASRLRLRPILMTSLAFVLGVVPLVMATGAGAEMRQSLGIAVFSGMLGVTAFGLLFTPVFFSVIEGLSERPIFAPVRTQWLVSMQIGGLVGLAIGWLSWKANFVELGPGIVAGACLGALAALAVQGVFTRRQTRPPITPAPPHNPNSES
ncbi:MAG TPA: multidrug efflux RND transporter permease subunit [Pirellulales bacterium]|nr:multidrug efflux RND transporter permease subunit [Pirellulales bacterium]